MKGRNCSLSVFFILHESLVLPLPPLCWFICNYSHHVESPSFESNRHQLLLPFLRNLIVINQSIYSSRLRLPRNSESSTLMLFSYSCSYLTNLWGNPKGLTKFWASSDSPILKLGGYKCCIISVKAAFAFSIAQSHFLEANGVDHHFVPHEG